MPSITIRLTRCESNGEAYDKSVLEIEKPQHPYGTTSRRQVSLKAEKTNTSDCKIIMLFSTLYVNISIVGMTIIVTP
jgi:hypothetical protein